MKYKILILPLLFLSIACGNDKQAAEDMLGKAEQYYLSGDYVAATQWIDSINVVYPQEVEVIRNGMMLQCKVNQKMYERELIHIDSLYNAVNAEVATLKPQFELVREGKEQTVANYIYKNSHRSGEISHSEIYAQVTEKGDFQLTSIYFGGRKINHTGISVKRADGSMATTQAIAYDGGKNYRYTTGNNAVEIVTYNLAQCREVAEAIANFSGGSMRVSYTGGKDYGIKIGERTSHAIAASYRLALALAQSDSLQSRREYSILQLELADRQLMKLEEKATETGEK